jgi:PAS domain S-box-containing protein
MPDTRPHHRAAPAGAGPDYRALFEGAPDAALVLDADGRVLDANARACELFGFARAAFVGRELADAAGYVGRALAAGPCRDEAAHCRADGTVLRLEVSAAAVGPAVLATYRDATDRRRTEEGLRRAARLEAVGQLAGGVAHDFNNMLTVIAGYADVAADRLPADDPAGDALTEIRAAAHRAADLVRQLLAFSRQQVVRPRPVRLAERLADLRKMLARLLGEDVRLVTAADPDLAAVRADPTQIDQVLVNLAVNARDAMPAGGTLTIECRNLPAGDDRGRVVRLTVSDTGTGMTEEVKARIFEPFFTTKPAGKGTGLGLATVFGIVRQAGGTIGVESRPGLGTTFRVDLPAAEAADEPDAPAAPRPAGVTRGSETILLVEDEDAVRMMALHVLQASGYQVLDAESGEQALRAVQSFGVPIRLLVTDVVLPGLGGRELADRLSVVQPAVRVLYTSGHTEDEVVRRGVETGRAHFLPKPFSPRDLIRRVREVLDGA